MKNRRVFLVFLSLLVVALAGTSYAWQGRMGGMGDPYGLVQDESDFLIHPAKIANGEGVRFYGDYRFTYTGVTDWDYDLYVFNPAGTLTDFFDFYGSGQEYKHNALVGAAFPLGPGRMGLFFQYDGMRGDYDGNEHALGLSNFAEYNLTKNLDNFALRLLYGLPLGGNFNLGGEVQFAYRQEKSSSWQTIGPDGYLNIILSMEDPSTSLLPFLFPYDSDYWEALFKGSLEGKVGPLDLEFTLRGGFLFAGNNTLTMETQLPVGTMTNLVDFKGDVQGWQIGEDLWLRYPLAKDLALPFLVRIDYQSKIRDGHGPGQYGWTPWPDERYKNEENDFLLTVGGGLDKQLGTGTKTAAGIYYNYLRGENGIKLHVAPLSIEYFDSIDFPASTEHQVMLRLAGEHEFSPMVALRMGLNFFYGWVSEDFKFTYSFSVPIYTDDISPSGYHWGIGASLGGTIKIPPVTLEPFIAGGWQQYRLNGNGDRIAAGTIINLWEMDKSRSEWNIGGGLSILFNL
jgi:hypothetical protein